jgi:hypothetical protein
MRPQFENTAGAVPTACLSSRWCDSNWPSGRRWNTPFKIFHRNLFLNCLANPLGIGCSTETTHTVLLVARVRVFDKVQFRHGDFGWGNAQQRKYSASKSPWLFCSTFCVKTKSGIEFMLPVGILQPFRTSISQNTLNAITAIASVCESAEKY